MANHPSALKRHRQSEKRRRRNQALKSEVRHLVRRVRTAVSGNDAPAATTALGQAARALDKSVAKGLLHRNNASRRIARLARAVHVVTGGAKASS